LLLRSLPATHLPLPSLTFLRPATLVILSLPPGGSLGGAEQSSGLLLATNQRGRSFVVSGHVQTPDHIFIHL
jgi:hypothetical protein